MIQIPPATLLLTQLPKTPRESIPHVLKLGQILQARVLSENLAGRIKLSIGGTELTARTPLQVTAGQSLTLQVISTAPLPELKPLSLSSPPPLQNEALKRILPRQRPLSELFELLPQLRSMKSHNPAQDQIKQAVQALVEHLLRVDHPRFRQGLKTALLDSGLFTERHLVQQEPRGNDLKLKLLRLYDLVKTLLPQAGLTPDRREQKGPAQDRSALQPESNLRQLTDLLKRLDGAIARIQTHQLASLPKDDPTAQV